MALVAIPFGLGIGLSLGMVGGGGSVLAVPVLVYVLGQSVHQATTASLVVVSAGALTGGLSHAREGRVCWRHAVASRRSRSRSPRAWLSEVYWTAGAPEYASCGSPRTYRVEFTIT